MSDPTVMRIRAELYEHADKAYQAFMIKCNPEAEHSIGVRIPIVQKLAKRLMNSDFHAYIEGDKEFFEEIMLEGILIASAAIGENERFDYLTKFVPKIYDWCACDTVCSSFRRTLPSQIAPSHMWDFLMQYRNSTSEFELRFMLVMIKAHFIDSEHLPEIFKILDSLGPVPHYASMGASWLLAELIAKERNATITYLESSKLPTNTFNKGLQKACESYRVAPVDKDLLRKLKRH